MALTANTNPNPNLVELTRILERHTSIWFSDPVLFDPSVDTEVKKRTSGQVSGECVVCYNNLLSGESSLSSLKDVRKLAGRPLFYRLNYIRQLSTTHLAVDLDGTHNRLSHCLGTLDIASRFESECAEIHIGSSPCATPPARQFRTHLHFPRRFRPLKLASLWFRVH